jgi:hypothetical protein
MLKKNFLLLNISILIAMVLTLGWASYTYIYPYFASNKLVSDVRAEETVKVPPVITGITVDEVTSTSTTISWNTDKETDSLVNFNISRDYGVVRSPVLGTKHKLIVPELLSDQQYYYRIISTDKDGNQSISNDLLFSTKPGETPKPVAPPEQTPNETPDETNPEVNNGAGMGPGEGGKNDGTMEQSELIQETISLLENIDTEEGLSLIESKIRQVASEKAMPPVISGAFAKVEVGTDWAKVSWKTDKDSTSIVAYASEDDYSPNSYRVRQGDPNNLVQNHEVMIQGLRPATTYHYQVQSKSNLGLESNSDDSTFKTKSIMPEIFNINIAKVEEEAATINFNTNVPCSAIIEYTELSSNATKLEGNTTFVNDHEIRIKGLKFDSYYSAVIKVENEQGEKTVSAPITFTTVRDIVAPVIAKVNTESTLFPGTENKTQTIISWRTDEPSVCQFFYQKAASEASPPLDKEVDYTANHVQVVTAFQPASVYKFWIECFDKTGNKVKSEDYSMLTPAKEESVLDMIIKNFEGTFGWLKKK